MFGGTETVASAIEWALTELMHTPEALKRVQQELADVVGLDRRVEESDFEKLTYFKCVIKETLRMHPPIPVLLRQSSEDTEVAGYHIPKGTLTVTSTRGRIPTHSTHRASCKAGHQTLKEATTSFFLLGLVVGRAPGCNLDCTQWRWPWLIFSIHSHGSCQME